MKMDDAVAKTTRFFHLMRLVVCVVFVVTSIDAHAKPSPRARAQNPRYAMLIMDAQTGKVLAQENADKPLPPASLTKLMTLFMAFEAIENKKLRMDSHLVITPNAISQPPSKLGMTRDEKITVKQAIHILVTRSANDVAMAMAETIGGSQQNFTKMMTARARSLGMKNSVFYNPSGLPNPGQKSTARDMAILGRALMQYFPQHYHVFNTIRFNYKGRTIETHNNLMRRYKGMDGMKTGYTVASGFNLVASAVRDNRRVIVVVFGGRSAVTRDNHVADLMTRGLDQMTGKSGNSQMMVASAPKAAAPVKSPAKAVTVKPAPKPAQKSAQKPATAQTTAAAANRGAWTPDGGSVRPLQAPSQPAPIQQAAYQSATRTAATHDNRNWGIQVGAFNSPVLSQQSVQAAQSKLRDILGGEGQGMVVPANTAQGTVYRARIIGLSAQNAARACQALNECMAFTTR